ncbi:MAG: hypothetical protein ACFE94_19420 [Candidatus Hodarchaeota archaeon]
MFLDRFRKSLNKRILYLLAILGFLIVLLVEIFVFIPIEATVSKYGILDYEFAWTSSRVEIIFSVWGTSGIDRQLMAIYWDFLFIVGYVSLAFALVTLVLQSSTGKLEAIGTYITITPFLTGIFDIIENTFLVLMANTPTAVSNILPLIASLSATVKFGFLFVAIIYFGIVLLFILIDKFIKKKQ